MKNRLFLPIVLGISTVWMMQWYFGKENNPPAQGVVNVGSTAQVNDGVIRVSQTQDLLRPLSFDVAFAPEKIETTEQIEIVKNNLVTLSFSSFGAVLKDVSFNMYKDKDKQPLKTIEPHTHLTSREAMTYGFLLALDQDTPYVYRLVDRTSEADCDILVYQSQNDDWMIKKIYSIYKLSYRIDLSVTIEAKTFQPENNIRPRLMLVAPLVNDFKATDTVTPFRLQEESNSIEKIEITQLRDAAWLWKTSRVLFGFENRYFVHSLVNDPDKFVQRAYIDGMYDVERLEDRYQHMVLEGPQIRPSKELTAWNMSFYIGPKVYDQLSLVDDRLPELLSFGWLSAICTFLLQLLSLLVGYLGNYGLAIIGLAVLLHIPFIPLSVYSRRKMDEYQKHSVFINRIRMKYRNDAKMQQQEVLRYHQDHNLSLFTPLIGVLRMIIQIPIMLSLYRVLSSYLELYQAPFFGWVVDLSSKDPFYILPILMGVTMIWQQSLTPGQDSKQRVISMFMGVVMTVVFSNFPAGLVLYWLMNNVLTLVEDYARRAFMRA